LWFFGCFFLFFVFVLVFWVFFLSGTILRLQFSYLCLLHSLDYRDIPPYPACFFKWNFALFLCWPQTVILPVSTSWAAGTPDVYHHTQHFNILLSTLHWGKEVMMSLIISHWQFEQPE
jgi:hypothetical protein